MPFIQQSLTFCDIPSNTIVQYINHGNPAMAFGWPYIFLRQHQVRHEHDIEAQALYPNLMSLYTVVNSAKGKEGMQMKSIYRNWKSGSQSSAKNRIQSFRRPANSIICDIESNDWMKSIQNVHLFQLLQCIRPSCLLISTNGHSKNCKNIINSTFA